MFKLSNYFFDKLQAAFYWFKFGFTRYGSDEIDIYLDAEYEAFLMMREQILTILLILEDDNFDLASEDHRIKHLDKLIDMNREIYSTSCNINNSLWDEYNKYKTENILDLWI